MYLAPPLTLYYADSAKLKSCDIWKGMKLESFRSPSLSIRALFLSFLSATKDTEALDLPCMMTRNNLPTPAGLLCFPLPSHFFLLTKWSCFLALVIPSQVKQELTFYTEKQGGSWENRNVIVPISFPALPLGKNIAGSTDWKGNVAKALMLALADSVSSMPARAG